MSVREMSLYEVIESLPPMHGARAEFSALLARIPPCVCGEPTLGVVHRADGPCYLPEQAPPAAVPAEPSNNEVMTLAHRLHATANFRLGPVTIRDIAREALRWRDETQPQQPAAAVPEGYALVPVEPTREMRRAAIGEYEDATDARLPDGDGYDEEIVTRLYRAMLAAAARKGE